MLITTPLVRVALVLVLTAFTAALMVVRIGSTERRAPIAAKPITPVSLVGHTPGSGAHARHEYRLELAAAADSSGR